MFRFKKILGFTTKKFKRFYSKVLEHLQNTENKIVRPFQGTEPPNVFEHY